MTVCTPDAARRSGKNFGEKIVEEYMRRRRWFVSARSVEQLGRTIAVREGYVGADGRGDAFVSKQITKALQIRLGRGEIKVAKRGGVWGYRKTSIEERRRFAERGRPGKKPQVYKRQRRASIRYAY